MDLKIITIESEAFYALIEEVSQKIEKPKLERFILEPECMELLGIRSKSHLWKLRVEGKISYFQDPDHKKLILYDRHSIEEYLTKNLKSSF